MAALCTGNYGLSQNYSDDNKEYFFVKLTDSGYRAIEEYQRNLNKYSAHATIQITGKEGVLCFPTLSGNVRQEFSFTIDELEGSIECIEQEDNKFNVLGVLPYKMRIHATDDVYEKTKHRMAVAEETQKNKCTRVIKPNQTDIGRKVKLKNSINRLTNIPPKRDNLVNSISSSSPVSSSSSSSLLNNALASNNLPSSLSPISNLSGSYNSNNNTNSININNNNSSSNISNSNNLTSTTITSIGNHHSSNSSSYYNSNGTLRNSPNSNLSTTTNAITINNSLNNHFHHSSNHNHHHNSNSLSSKLSSSGLTPGISPALSLSSALSSAAGSGTSGINSGYYSNNSHSSNNSRNSNSSILFGSAAVNSRKSSLIGNGNSGRQKNGIRHMPDITKRKIRERLIHLLALKPFKKPELYARLQNEGIREKEKNLISGILKEISTMRDNTYNLKRQIWNDVIEDWPFYTEQEIQMLKRRKPQNLTPPISSDGGSSTSGQSPTSTHNGSPPPAVKRPSCLDRERFYDEPIAKKQRISHFRKDTNDIIRRTNAVNSRDPIFINSRTKENQDIRPSNYFGSTKHHQEPEENAMSLSFSVLGHEAARRITPQEEFLLNGGNSEPQQQQPQQQLQQHQQPQQQQQQHQQPQQQQQRHHHHSSYQHNNDNHITINNNSNSLKDNSRQSPLLFNSNSNGTSNSSHHNNHTNNNNNHHNANNTMDGGDNVHLRNSNSPSPLLLGNSISNGIISDASPIRPPSGDGGGGATIINHQHHANNTPSLLERASAINNHSVIINNNNNNSDSSNHQHRINNNNNNNNSNNGNSNSNNNNNIDSNNCNSSTTSGPLTNNKYDFSRFTKITSIEQRRLYKTEFEKDYDEYKELLLKIDSVGKHFQTLAQRLNNARNNDANYKSIKKQILSEYEKIKRDQEHQKGRQRFDYLHAKLALIKSLVNEFDEQIKSSLSTTNDTNSDNRISLSPSTANMNSLNTDYSSGISPSIQHGSAATINETTITSSSRKLSSPLFNSSLSSSQQQIINQENY